MQLSGRSQNAVRGACMYRPLLLVGLIAWQWRGAIVVAEQGMSAAAAPRQNQPLPATICTKSQI